MRTPLEITPLAEGEVSLIYYRKGDALPVALTKEQHEMLQAFTQSMQPIRIVSKVKYSLEGNE